MGYCKHSYRYSKSRKVHICRECGYQNYNYTKLLNTLKIGLPCVSVVVIGILVFSNFSNNNSSTELIETINKPQMEESKPVEKLTPTKTDNTIVRSMTLDILEEPDKYGRTTIPDEQIQYGDNFLVISELEMQIHYHVNEERKNYGLNPLLYDYTLAVIARSHSKDMADRNYFEHDTPEGIEPADRGYQYGYFHCGDIDTIKLRQEYDRLSQEYDTLVKQFESTGNTNEALYNRIQQMYSKLKPMSDQLNSASEQKMIFGGISENIALNNLYDSIWYTNNIPTSYDWNTQEELAESIVDGWMNSKGHRENILTPYYSSEGIGVAVSNDNRVYATQNFC